MHRGLLAGALLAPLLLLGCKQDSGFQNNIDDHSDIEGAGHISIDPTELTWTDLELLKAKSLPLVVSNVGDFDLKMHYGRIVSDPSNAFYTDEDANDERTIKPGNSFEVLVVCDLPTEADATGTLRISSNDSDQPVLDVPLNGYFAGDSGDTGDSGDSGT